MYFETASVNGPANGMARTQPMRDASGNFPKSFEVKRYGGGERRAGAREEMTTILKIFC